MQSSRCSSRCSSKRSSRTKRFRVAALHLRHVLESQVIGHQRGDLRGVVVRKAQPPADLFSHARAHFHVTIEANPAIRSRRRRKRRRLADVVQQDAPRQSRRTVLPSALPASSACESTRRLRDGIAAAARLPSSAKFREEACGSKPVSSSSSNPRRAAPSVSSLVSSSRTRSAETCADFRRELLNRAQRFGLDRVAESRGEAHGAQHPAACLRGNVLRRGR